MVTVSELTSKNIAAAQANVRNWGKLVYNVSEHGLLGDGVTDDTAKLQALVDLAISEGRKTIAFSSGTYFVTALTNDDQVFFVGDNASFTGGYAGHIEQLGEMGVTQSELDAHLAENVVQAHTIVDASATDRGFVNTTSQIFAGLKTINGVVAKTSDGGGGGLFGISYSLIILFAVDKTAPLNYIFAIGYKGEQAVDTHTLNIISSNVLGLGTKNNQGTQIVTGGTAGNIIVHGISIVL